MTYCHICADYHAEKVCPKTGVCLCRTCGACIARMSAATRAIKTTMRANLNARIGAAPAGKKWSV